MNFFFNKIFNLSFLSKTKNLFLLRFRSNSDLQFGKKKFKQRKKIGDIFFESGYIFFVGSFAPHRGLRPQAPDAFGLNPPSQIRFAKIKSPRNLKLEFCEITKSKFILHMFQNITHLLGQKNWLILEEGGPHVAL